jgi:hypothetical protein
MYLNYKFATVIEQSILSSLLCVTVPQSQVTPEEDDISQWSAHVVSGQLSGPYPT